MKRVAAIAIAVAVPCFVSAQSFTQIVAFGDSLSDVGNVNNQTFGISPGSGYFQGRFSNGPVWIENVASSYSLPALDYSRKNGKNYAYGGVKTGSGSTSYFIFSFPNIGTQINNYLGSNTANASTLYSLWGGGNDLMDNLAVNTQAVVNNLVNHVTALNNAGGRYVIVPNLPPLGEIPKYRNTANRTAYNTLTGNFNSQLAAAMTTLDGQLPIKIYQLDVQQMFNEVFANPAGYGFSNVTTQAFANGSAVANPDQYLFWDDVHPTRIGHQQVAGRVTDLIDTHEWVATNGAWSTAANWDVAGTPAGNWIASLKNTSASEKEVAISSSSSVRKLLVSGGVSEMTLAISGGSTLSVSQSAAIQSGGVIRFEVAGAASHGRLSVGGAVTLAGEIEIATGNGYIPLPGSTFTPLTFASRTGSATIVNGTGFAGLSFAPAYTATSLTLTASATPGDANLDAFVDSIDFNLLTNSFGGTGTNWLGADFTGDTRTDSIDFNLLAGNFGVSPQLGAVVPEPALLMPLFGLIIVRRQRRRG